MIKLNLSILSVAFSFCCGPLYAEYTTMLERAREVYVEDIGNFPTLLVDGYIAAEDPEFRDRLLWRSPLTQALAIDLADNKDETGVALREISNAFTHDELLSLLLNGSYFGRGCQGVKDAAQGFFGVPLSDTTATQQIMLAALAKAPGFYLDNLDKLHERMGFVGNQLAHSDLIEEGLRLEIEGLSSLDFIDLDGCRPQ